MTLEFKDYYNNDRYESPPLAAPCNPFTDIYYNDIERKIKTGLLPLLNFIAAKNAKDAKNRRAGNVSSRA